MKAAVFQGPSDIAVRDVPVPRITENEVLVDVRACGICGTDLRIEEGQFDARYPVIAGHEFCGEVVEAGAEVTHLQVGDMVAVNPNTPCRRCPYCYRGLFHLCDSMTACGVTYDGGFAQLCKVSSELALPVPDGDQASAEKWAMMEPVSCCLHGIDVAGVRPGDSVVILGGGSIGLLLCQIARHAGATTLIVSEPTEAKRELALACGADEVLDPVALGDGFARAVRDLTGGGADVVIEAAGLAVTAQAALPLVRKGGTLLYFGVCPRELEVPIRPFDIYHYEITIKGTFTNPLTDSRALELLASGRVQVESLITHRFGLDEIQAGLDAGRSGQTVKAIVVP